ncbi:MAG: hypothetical protein GYB64_14150 [Chloroflexi bacterium]|nr:hypothetical protein [Chloroflexota bacterium]
MLEQIINGVGALSDPIPLAVLGVVVVLTVVLGELARRDILTIPQRRLSAYEAVTSQIGRAVESGGRVHTSTGPNSIVNEDTGTTVAALAILDVVTTDATISDQQPIATTADATALPIISDTLYRAYTRSGASGKYDTTSARLIAFDSTTLVGGLTVMVPDDDLQANLLVGSFGSEVALAAEAGQRHGISQTIGSDRVEGQAAAYASAEHILIGEELFVSRAYLDEAPAAQGGLATQDILRWGVIAAILVGSVLASLGLLGQ